MSKSELTNAVVALFEESTGCDADLALDLGEFEGEIEEFWDAVQEGLGLPSGWDEADHSSGTLEQFVQHIATVWDGKTLPTS